MVDIILPDNIFYSFFLPFVGIVTIIFGLLITLKILDKKTSMFVAVIIALFVLGGNNLPIITKLFSGGGFLVMLTFFVVFILIIALRLRRE